MIMEELLQRLEKKIKELIDQHASLQHFNQQLHQNKHMLTREKNALLARQQKAISQIESLVVRLKAIETLP